MKRSVSTTRLPCPCLAVILSIADISVPDVRPSVAVDTLKELRDSAKRK